MICLVNLATQGASDRILKHRTSSVRIHFRKLLIAFVVIQIIYIYVYI